ncbi:MAG TPA: DUF4124 domain-containing protein [Arenimonas sp.]|uniref:DUF4124 domain-containing protein n=1 Tax=Arenimonas sp. TaxID=1872635 RepID=UPI002C114E3E|nr:DUF4124 domain-containing protein [Arenimonas sp.]HMB57971.1 DUF4124 domain-containing protein [Arenimonas sp.]
MIRPTLLFIACLALLPASLSAQTRVYKWTDAQGVVHYSQIEPKQAAKTRDFKADKPAPPAKPKVKTPEELACERAKLNDEALSSKDELRADTNGDGKPEVMSAEDRAKAQELTKRQLSAYCAPSK